LDKLRKGQNFTIPEGYAHQLERTGQEELVILFSCPDSHLDNDKDRLMLSDAPGLTVPPPRPPSRYNR
jgi:dTDP-4-dehydrorhamnose 3,5-epimerase-like enzyme